MMTILSKAEIYRQMERFWKDQDKTLSIAMFAELSGLSASLLKRVFQVKDTPMSEHTQIAVTRAFVVAHDSHNIPLLVELFIEAGLGVVRLVLDPHFQGDLSAIDGEVHTFG